MPQTLTDPPLLLTFEQAGQLLGLSRSTIYRMVDAGRLPVVRFRRLVRIPREAVEQLAEQGENPGNATSRAAGPDSRTTLGFVGAEGRGRKTS